MPKILYPNGDLQYLCKLLPTPIDLIFRRFFPHFYKKAGLLSRYELRDSGYDHTMMVPSLSGCFMLLRSGVLRRVGGFDEKFFMYLEDVDLCRRIGKIAETVYYPDVTVFHEFSKGSYKLVFTKWLEQIESNIPLTIFGSGKQTRDFTYIADSIDGLVRGIKLDDIAPLMQTGIHGVAVSSAINLAENKIEMTKKFRHELSLHFELPLSMI